MSGILVGDQAQAAAINSNAAVRGIDVEFLDFVPWIATGRSVLTLISAC